MYTVYRKIFFVFLKNKICFDKLHTSDKVIRDFNIHCNKSL